MKKTYKPLVLTLLCWDALSRLTGYALSPHLRRPARKADAGTRPLRNIADMRYTPVTCG